MDSSVASQMPPQPPSSQEGQQVNVMDVEIKDENTSLNVLVTFLNIAQKRGAFNIQESAKIWECIKLFQKNAAAAEAPAQSYD